MTEPLFRKPQGVRTRWASFENPLGKKGGAATENLGAKGHSADSIEPGQTITLAHVEQEAGIIRRVWLTVSDRSPLMLRGLRIECFWDGANRPAVSAPLGDFFGVSVGRRVAFESAFFTDAEGRSFVCHIPMPFKSGARITLTNDTDKRLNHLFYDVNYELHYKPDPSWMYLHAHWRRENPTTLGVDYTILPRVAGSGRFLGVVCGVIADKRYNSWFGEGEVKIFLDGDTHHPTLAGTGLEDYVGDAWGLKPFATRYGGAPVVDNEAGLYSFYRFHVPDPIYFDSDVRVTIQQIGCCGADLVTPRRFAEQKLPHKFTLWDRRSQGGLAFKLLEETHLDPLTSKEMTSGALHYYRVDDYSSCAYFYLDRPTNGLPVIAPLAERVAGLVDTGAGRERVDL